MRTRGVYKTQSNIYDGAFSRQQFLQDSSIIDVWPGFIYASRNIPYFRMMSYSRGIYLGLYKTF